MKVKVYCHTCNGLGKVAEESYPSKAKVMVLCPECCGLGWVEMGK